MANNKIGQKLAAADQDPVLCDCGRSDMEFSACTSKGVLEPGDTWHGEHLLCPCGVVVRTLDWVIVAVVGGEVDKKIGADAR